MINYIAREYYFTSWKIILALSKVIYDYLNLFNKCILQSWEQLRNFFWCAGGWITICCLYHLESQLTGGGWTSRHKGRWRHLLVAQKRKQYSALKWHKISQPRGKGRKLLRYCALDRVCKWIPPRPHYHDCKCLPNANCGLFLDTETYTEVL